MIADFSLRAMGGASVLLCAFLLVSPAKAQGPALRPPFAEQSLVFGQPVDCTGWRHNPDGSWSQTKTIVSGGVTFSNNTFKNTGETRILDRACSGL